MVGDVFPLRLVHLLYNVLQNMMHHCLIIAKLEQIGDVILWVHRVELGECKYDENLNIITIFFIPKDALAPLITSFSLVVWHLEMLR